MGISLNPRNLDEKTTVKDYGQAKRTPPKLRWFLIIGLVSIPLVALLYMLLNETVLAEFQGVVVFDTVKIRAPEAGYVETLYVKEGEHIQRGTVLLQFKSPKLDTELTYLRQEKERMDRQIENISRKSTESLREHLVVLEKDIQSSQLVYDKFAKYYKPRGHIAALDLEQARKNVIKAKEAYSQLKYQIKQVVLENDLMVEVNYKRQVEDVNNKIRQAELKKKYFLIKSPAKGSIKQIEIHRGEFLPGGQDIMDIVTKNNLHVVAFIDPKEAKNVHPGIIVKMTFPDNFKAEGKVINVPNYADKTPLSFQNPMATRENKLVAIIKFTKELPKKYRVFGLPVDVDID
ncbi:MAG: HlyD family efflux transporter periplasmic adaptor subunit [Gammaproteobacteria bacterium]|nr:HlyD family efflux transporter periplasmic adaptor subunit [Gammaproteobacteria bacterium]